MALLPSSGWEAMRLPLLQAERVVPERCGDGCTEQPPEPAQLRAAQLPRGGACGCTLFGSRLAS